MTEYFIKNGKRYISVGQNIPDVFGPGIWYISHNGFEKMCDIGELEDPKAYAKNKKCRDKLSSFIRLKFNHYFGDTIEITKDGWRYTLPSCSDIASDILKFLSMSETRQKAEISKLETSISHLDLEGNILDNSGRILYHNQTGTAVRRQIEELKDKILELEQLYTKLVIEEL